MARRFGLNFEALLDGDTAALSDGSITFMASGTSNLVPAYADPGQTLLKTNPVTLDADGKHGDIFVPAVCRVVVKDKNGAVVARGDIDPVDNGTSNTAWAGTLPGAVALFPAPLNLEDGQALVVSGRETVNDGYQGTFIYKKGDNTTVFALSALGFVDAAGRRWFRVFGGPASVLWFGVKGDGIADDTAPLQAAASSGVKDLYIPAVPVCYRITDVIDIPSAIRVTGAGNGSFVRQDILTKSVFGINGRTGTQIGNLRLGYVAGSSSTAYVGCVYVVSSNKIKIYEVECDHPAWGGVTLTDSNNCEIRGCYSHDIQSSAQDSHDIGVFDNASFNDVHDNQCYGGLLGDHGVIVQGRGFTPPGTAPFGNRIVGNHVTEHKAYGIAVYQGVQRDTETLILGNTVQDITGTAIGGASGHGIYVQTSGGCVVENNKVSNCNISTSSTTNGAGAICVAFNATTPLGPVSICSNKVVTSHWRAMDISGIGSVASGTTVICNDNVLSTSDDVNGVGISCVDIDDATITGNKVTMGGNSTRQGILVSANTADRRRVVVSSNIVNVGKAPAIDIAGIGGNIMRDVTVSANVVAAPGAGGVAVSIRGADGFIVNGNRATGGTGAAGAALFVNGASNGRGGGNVLRCPIQTFLSAGTCTNVFFDASNDYDLGTSHNLMQNQAAGVNVEAQIAAAPGGGTWQRGDRAWLTQPSAAAAPGMVCTAAGGLGTWKNMANLAA